MGVRVLSGLTQNLSPHPTATTVPSADPPAPPQLSLQLLGRFGLLAGRLGLGTAAQRLLAFAAVRGGRVLRLDAAHALWPDVTEVRANANLRSALWRLQRTCPDLLRSVGAHAVELTPVVAVDLHVARGIAAHLLDPSRPLTQQELGVASRAHLHEDLLPEWPDEEWLASEREQFRQLRLHALEALCQQLSAAGWHGAAVQAGLTAVRGDPLRESSHHVLANAYLAEGNTHDALRQRRRCAALLRDELGVEPAMALTVPRSDDHPSHPGQRASSRIISRVTVPAGSQPHPHLAHARFFRVLGDPTRLAIITHLLAGPHTVTELVSKVGGTQSRISNHLACLRWCQFVISERRGRQVVYSVTDTRLRQLFELTNELTADNADHLENCHRIGPDWT